MVMPKHDNPSRRRNIAATNGALNLIDEEYLNTCVSQIKNHLTGQGNKVLTLGLLLGGDTKDFHLSGSSIRRIIEQLKESAENLDAQIVVTTSRRTSPEIERIVKEEFKSYSRCRLLIIANENNLPFAMGGILGLSKILIVSPESISMISEAVSSRKYVVTFKAAGLSKRHQNFLKQMALDKHLYLIKDSDLIKTIKTLEENKPEIKPLRDEAVILEKLGKIL